ncbi:nitrate reductase [Celeribacter marinus]|uniref:Assimilatory nitrate reductase large subunit n=1 Tax=Celeribacter marinus TaxID=1397108 RepID=A0A0P0A1P7_9RHOB|nr:nitrate reductase [Celeribacter marinus]ALI54126.1 assimilatory nitrate reductase large subunit [Celeribacter marinus]SFL02072.1 assimilatory nitrate reductase (NADH) alpha subunit apoprotein [Celeribacter marinus]
MTLTKTVCPYCGVGCGVLAGADGTIKGDPDHPANFGRLCSKGTALSETIDLEGRLLAPKVHGVDTDWDTALDLVASKFSEAIRDHGPDSVAFYVSGQLLTEDYYVANKLMKGFIGSANIDTNSRLCMASSVAGHKRAFGSDTVPGIYEDLEDADLIVLVGSNLAWCHPVLHQRIAAAKTARPDMKVVNIDPRRTATTDLADVHLRVAPDGDVALFNGLLTYLAETKNLDHAYLDAHVAGAREAIELAAQTDPSQSGLSPEGLAQFYALWAGTPKVVTVYSQGVNQSTSGTDKVNAIINCHLATGRIGKAGCGPFSVTGQPNAMGGREVGGMANMLANHLDIENAGHRDAVQGFWASPTICTSAGLKAIDLFQACAAGKIKALWIISTNPAVSMPDAKAVAAAIANVPFVAVSDIMARTDTGDLSDVLLPATGWGEKDGTVTNSERRISRQRAFLPRPEMARPDWKIICDVAQKMGWGDAFSYRSAAEVFAEYVALSAATRDFGRDLDLSIFADADYADLIPTQWPNNKRFFANGGFFHPDGKARMIAVTPPVAVPSEGLTLNTGRNRDQWHTMTRTGKAPRLGAHLAEPYAEMHPDDATAMGVGYGDLVAVKSLHGDVILRALITDRATKGQVFAPMHWTGQQAASGKINQLITSNVDPISGQPALKTGSIVARRFEAAWFGFGASVSPLAPTGRYAAISRTATGWQGEFADTKAPDDWDPFVRDILAAPSGDISVLEDLKSGLVRIALHEGKRLTALFFASPTPVRLARSYVVSLIGTETSALSSLAGRGGADHVDAGAIICACMNVGVNTVRSAIADGARTVDAIGEVTCAGTNCGSCKPELSAILAGLQLPMAAE